MSWIRNEMQPQLSCWGVRQSFWTKGERIWPAQRDSKFDEFLCNHVVSTTYHCLFAKCTSTTCCQDRKYPVGAAKFILVFHLCGGHLFSPSPSPFTVSITSPTLNAPCSMTCTVVFQHLLLICHLQNHKGVRTAHTTRPYARGFTVFWWTPPHAAEGLLSWLSKAANTSTSAFSNYTLFLTTCNLRH